MLQLTNYLFWFFFPQLDVSAVKAQWSGIDCVARSFTRYENGKTASIIIYLLEKLIIYLFVAVRC